MDNVFDILAKNTGKPRTADAEALKALSDNPGKPAAPQQQDMSDIPVKTLVGMWQKEPRGEYTAELLRRMKPTMTAAVNSYAAGAGDKYDIKAARLTLDALKNYDPSYGTEPATFVFNNLKRLNRIAGKATNIMNISEAQAMERKLLMEASARFEDDKGREPSVAELSDLTGLSRKKVIGLLDSESVVVPESATLTENMHDTVTSSDINDDDCFEYVYMSVGPIDQKIMEWTSGKHGKQALSNNQIATKLRISPAAVSQRKNKIMTMLSDARSLI